MLALIIGCCALAAVLVFWLGTLEDYPEPEPEPDLDWRNAIPERWRVR